MENLFVKRIKLNKDGIEMNKYPFNIECLANFDELVNLVFQRQSFS